MADKVQILFVDDEPRILRGLRRQLELKGDSWNLLFASSGSEALDILAKEPCDVLITDTHMPGLNGTALLQAVTTHFPQTIRFVLSGPMDKEETLKLAGVAHQILHKPCAADTLQIMLAQALNMRRLLASAELRALTSQLNTLPTVPALFRSLLAEIQSAEANVKRVGQIIGQDMAMTAKILQLVNSAFFGLRQHITDPAQAVMFLGLDVVKALVLSAHVFSQFDAAKLGGISPEGLQGHSLSVAILARRIAQAEQMDPVAVDFAFTAGLLHDLGQLILATNLPQQYRQVLQQVTAQKIPLIEAEQQLLGATHPEVGAYLLGIWGIPQPVVEALAYHHCPATCLTRQFGPLAIVHVANCLVWELAPNQAENPLPQLDQAYLTELNVRDHLPHWREMSQKIVQNERS